MISCADSVFTETFGGLARRPRMVHSCSFESLSVADCQKERPTSKVADVSAATAEPSYKAPQPPLIRVISSACSSFHSPKICQIKGFDSWESEINSRLFAPTSPKLLGGEHNHFMKFAEKRPLLGLGRLRTAARRNEEDPEKMRILREKKKGGGAEFCGIWPAKLKRRFS